MIIVSFNQIADVPPQDIPPFVMRSILHDAQVLIDTVDKEALAETLCEWECDLFMESKDLTQDWYIRGLMCICLRGLRGESRPNVLNISE